MRLLLAVTLATFSSIAGWITAATAAAEPTVVVRYVALCDGNELARARVLYKMFTEGR